jgi:hypothetical protein
MKNIHVLKENIYITSDEEIKVGQNYIGEGFSGKNKFKWTESQAELYLNIKKDIIILTTDQDLIKDGVQAIDDEFLEWFVKNPSCEEVEAIEDIIDCKNSLEFTPLFGYKIIIPKEEPKPHSFCETPNEKCTMNYCDDNGCQNRKREFVEPKMERSYSEEEVKRLAFKFYLEMSKKMNVPDNLITENYTNVDEWFKQLNPIKNK